MKEVKDQPPKTPKKPLVFYYLIVMIVVMLLNALLFPSMLNRQVTQVSYDTFLQMVDEGKVSEVAWEKDEEELVFIAKDADGKDAYYKTGVWPDSCMEAGPSSAERRICAFWSSHQWPSSSSSSSLQGGTGSCAESSSSYFRLFSVGRKI